MRHNLYRNVIRFGFGADAAKGQQRDQSASALSDLIRR